MINLAAIVLCFLAAFIALAIVQTWGKMIPTWFLVTSALLICGVLSLRGGVGMVQSMLQKESTPLLFIIVEPYFLLGGILFGISTFLYVYTNTNGRKKEGNKFSFGVFRLK
jgi:predicted membrane protein